MNIRTWREDAAARAFDPRELDAIQAGLDAVAARERAAPDVTCTLGQVALRR
jgi:hypothetical protein